jgi:hypothetical protein
MPGVSQLVKKVYPLILKPCQQPVRVTGVSAVGTFERIKTERYDKPEGKGYQNCQQYISAA